MHAGADGQVPQIGPPPCMEELTKLPVKFRLVDPQTLTELPVKNRPLCRKGLTVELRRQPPRWLKQMQQSEMSCNDVRRALTCRCSSTDTTVPGQYWVSVPPAITRPVIGYLLTSAVYRYPATNRGGGGIQVRNHHCVGYYELSTRMAIHKQTLHGLCWTKHVWGPPSHGL